MKKAQISKEITPAVVTVNAMKYPFQILQLPLDPTKISIQSRAIRPTMAVVRGQRAQHRRKAEYCCVAAPYANPTMEFDAIKITVVGVATVSSMRNRRTSTENVTKSSPLPNNEEIKPPAMPVKNSTTTVCLPSGVCLVRMAPAGSRLVITSIVAKPHCKAVNNTRTTTG